MGGHRKAPASLSALPASLSATRSIPDGESRPRMLTRGLPTSFPLGVGKGEGPKPLLVVPFQGGVGETGEAPPVADEASLFRGSGAIGSPKGAGNRNAAAVLKSKRPHVSGGGARGRGLCAKDLSPSPRPQRGRRVIRDHPSRGAYSYTGAHPGHGTAPRWGWCGCGFPPPPARGW